MLKLQNICIDCMKRFDSMGQPVSNSIKNVMRLYSFAQIPVLLTFWKGEDEVIAYLEKSGFIVTQEYPNIPNVIFVVPKVSVKEHESEKVFCFGNCTCE